mgnify:CR=1 FL=1
MTGTILGEGLATITDVPPTIVAVRLSLGHTEATGNHGISGSLTKVWRKNGVRNIDRNSVTTCGSNGHGKHKRHMWSPWFPQL